MVLLWRDGCFPPNNIVEAKKKNKSNLVVKMFISISEPG